MRVFLSFLLLFSICSLCLWGAVKGTMMATTGVSLVATPPTPSVSTATPEQAAAILTPPPPKPEAERVLLCSIYNLRNLTEALNLGWTVSTIVVMPDSSNMLCILRPPSPEWAEYSKAQAAARRQANQRKAAETPIEAKTP